jgi:hypothetical protein
MSGTTTQTVQSLITMALKQAGVLGVGQTGQAEDFNDAMLLLNQMVSYWNAQRWLVYGLEDIPFVSTGAESYTIGLNEQFNTPRPDRIESAYMVQNQGTELAVSYPLAIIPAYEDYVRIAVKALPSFASAVFYDAAYPVGNLYFWPIPLATQFTLHVIVKSPLQQFGGLTDTIIFPPPYQEALLYNLAERLRPMYGFGPDPTITALAAGALNTLRNSNAQVPRLTLPGNLPGIRGGSGYNPFSDNNG